MWLEKLTKTSTSFHLRNLFPFKLQILQILYENLIFINTIIYMSALDILCTVYYCSKEIDIENQQFIYPLTFNKIILFTINKVMLLYIHNIMLN